MGRRVVISVVLAALMSLGLISCGKESEVSKEDREAVSASWDKVYKAIDDNDIELLKSVCSSSITDEVSTEKYQDWILNSRKAMDGKPRKNFHISEYSYGDDGKEVNVHLYSRVTKTFVKEDGKWVLKEL